MELRCLSMSAITIRRPRQSLRPPADPPAADPVGIHREKRALPPAAVFGTVYLETGNRLADRISSFTSGQDKEKNRHKGGDST